MTHADEPLVSVITEPPATTAAELGVLWLAVTRAGGAVGFLTDSPESDVRAAAEQVVDDVRAGRQEMLAMTAGGTLAGAVFLRRGTGPVVAHRAEVVRLMIHPDVQGRGWGTTLLAAAADHARTAGLEQLLLTTRGGTHLPAYYAKLGWTQVGLVPRALRLRSGEYRDEYQFQLLL